MALMRFSFLSMTTTCCQSIIVYIELRLDSNEGLYLTLFSLFADNETDIYIYIYPNKTSNKVGEQERFISINVQLILAFIVNRELNYNYLE